MKKGAWSFGIAKLHICVTMWAKDTPMSSMRQNTIIVIFSSITEQGAVGNELRGATALHCTA